MNIRRINLSNSNSFRAVIYSNVGNKVIAHKSKTLKSGKQNPIPISVMLCVCQYAPSYLALSPICPNLPVMSLNVQMWPIDTI